MIKTNMSLKCTSQKEKKKEQLCMVRTKRLQLFFILHLQRSGEKLLVWFTSQNLIPNIRIILERPENILAPFHIHHICVWQKWLQVCDWSQEWNSLSKQQFSPLQRFAQKDILPLYLCICKIWITAIVKYTGISFIHIHTRLLKCSWPNTHPKIWSNITILKELNTWVKPRTVHIYWSLNVIFNVDQTKL